MEPSLYDDHCYSSVMNGESSQSNSPADAKPSVPITTTSVNTTTVSNIKDLKKSLTLDFNSPVGTPKKTLQTPDLIRLFQLTSPELEKILIPNSTSVATPTPTSFLCPQDVTSEQRLYAQGFLDALNQIHTVKGFSPPNPALLSPGFICNTLSAEERKAVSSSIGDSAASTSAAVSSSLAPSIPTVQSPTRATSTAPFASVIMHSYFQNSIPGFNTNPPVPVFQSFAPVVSSVGNAMSMLGVKREPIDRPPSQSVPSGHLEYTTLSHAQSIAPTTVVTNSSFQSMAPPQTTQYMDVTNNGHHSTPPPTSIARAGPRRGMGRSCIVKQDDVHMVPNVSESELTYGLGPSVSSTSTVPVNMMDQEKLKLERKRERNRVAADKCRKRKMERIGVLEDQVKGLEKKKQEQTDQVGHLREEVKRMRTMLQDHTANGCSVDSKIN